MLNGRHLRDASFFDKMDTCDYDEWTFWVISDSSGSVLGHASTMVGITPERELFSLAGAILDLISDVLPFGRPLVCRVKRNQQCNRICRTAESVT